MSNSSEEEPENTGRTEAEAPPAESGAPDKELSNLGLLLERMRLADYISMLQSPRRIVFINFIAGLARGLGMGLGMTILLGLVFYILHRMIDLPLVGEWIGKIVNIVQEQMKSGL
ncbi:MAG: DUF5665 domain-containing protein [bacterium]